MHSQRTILFHTERHGRQARTLARLLLNRSSLSCYGCESGGKRIEGRSFRHRLDTAVGDAWDWAPYWLRRPGSLSVDVSTVGRVNSSLRDRMDHHRGYWDRDIGHLQWFERNCAQVMA